MSDTQNGIQSFIELICHKYPLVGCTITLITGLVGTFLPDISDSVNDIEIPTIIMQLGQWFFWSLGGLVAVLTAIKLLKEIKKNKKNI